LNPHYMSSSLSALHNYSIHPPSYSRLSNGFVSNYDKKAAEDGDNVFLHFGRK
jgi:hypothetical protein